MQVQSYSDIEARFIEQVHRIVWCNVATIDTKDRPCSRILHPIWVDGIGYVITGRNTLKAKHIAHNPQVSLTYMQDPLKPIYVNCLAEWDESLEQKKLIFDLFCNTPPPLGWDVTIFAKTPDDPKLGLLKLTPRRIELAHLGGESVIWKAE